MVREAGSPNRPRRAGTLTSPTHSTLRSHWGHPVVKGNKISKRLAALQSAANLTISDLAVLIGRPPATVNVWLRETHHPRGISGDVATRRIEALEKMVKEDHHWLPVPVELTQRAHKAYVRELADKMGVPASVTDARLSNVNLVRGRNKDRLLAAKRRQNAPSSSA